jgi:ParB family transcriptional regulator, chromosome partitioning protein
MSQNVDPRKKSRLGRGLSSLISVSGGEPVYADVSPPLTPMESAELEAPPTVTAPQGTSALPPGLSGLVDSPAEAVARVASGQVSVPTTRSPSSQPAARIETHVERSVDDAPVVEAGTPALLPVEQVFPNPHQPRRDFDETTLLELSASIKQNGVIQPIVVKKTLAGFELIAGERRLRASKLAGLKTIPAVIREVDKWTQAQLALVENIQREDLNPIDRAEGYKTLVAELGLTQNELAVRLGEDRSTISNHLRLLELETTVQSLVRSGRLSLGHAKVLAGLPDKNEQVRLAELVVGQELSVRNLERIIAQKHDADDEATVPSAHLRDLELNITRQIGLKVQVRSGAKKGKGKVILHYNNLDEFDALIGRLGVKLDD